jgi:predicted MFS family arabinose efflux permease
LGTLVLVALWHCRGRLVSLARLLALNRTVAVVLLAVLLFGLGEQLWEPFLSVYFVALRELKREAVRAGELTASVLWTVGVYSSARNLFEAGCYVGGGQLTARLGDRGSLLLFGVLSVAGYVLFLVAPGPVVAIAAALLILGWEPLSVPVTFTTVGSTVDRAGQGMAFALQSIQKRLPKVLGPLIAGYALTWAKSAWPDPQQGRVAGMRLLVLAALALGVVSLAVQAWLMPSRKPPPPGPPAAQLLRSFHPSLKVLLAAEAFTRWGDWLVRDFVVLYLVLVRGAGEDRVGVLIAIQHATALITYLPVGRLTRSAGLQPFVGLTFVFFALFPLTLILVPDGWWLVVAFVVYGLREIGEPARKAMITGLLPEEVRARGVGLYWGVRAALICPASLAGAALWVAFGPEAAFVAAFASGCVGFVGYLLARRWLSS